MVSLFYCIVAPCGGKLHLKITKPHQKWTYLYEKCEIQLLNHLLTVLFFSFSNLHAKLQ